MSTLMCFIPMVAQKRHNLDYDNSRIQVKIFLKCLYVIVPMNPPPNNRSKYLVYI